MGVQQALVLVPEGVQVVLAVLLNLLKAGRIVHPLAVFKHLHLQLLHRVIGEGHALPGVHRVVDGQGPGGIEGLVVQGDQVGGGLAGLVVVDAPELLHARVGDLHRVFGDLDLGNHPSVHGLGAHLVHAAQRRAVLAGDELGAHAPGVDARALELQVANQVLVQVARSADDGVGIARRVQHLAGLAGEVGQVTAVQADAHRLVALGAQLVKDLDGVGHAGLERVVGVHQQQAAGGEHLGVLAEGGDLVREGHHPAVGVGARDGNVVHLAGEHVAGALAAADDGRARTVDARVGALGTAQAELHHRAALRRLHHAAGLGGDQRLVVDDVQERRLHQLRLEDGRGHADQRLAREHDGALRHGVHVAVEFKVAKLVQEVLVEDAQAPQVAQRLLVEAQVLQILDQLLQARHDRVVGGGVLAAIEHVKGRKVVPHAGLEVAVHHRQLVEIRHHRQISHWFHLMYLPCRSCSDCITRRSPLRRSRVRSAPR